MLHQPSASCEELHALQAKPVARVVAERRDLCRRQHLDASSIVRAVVEEGLLEAVQLLEPLIAQRPSGAPLELGGLELALVLVDAVYWSCS